MRVNEVGRIVVRGNRVEWYITHFFNFPQVTDVQICSSIFHFAGRLLQLRVFPNGMQFEGTSGWLGVSLINFTDPGNAPPGDVFRVRIGLFGQNREQLCISTAGRNRKWYKVDKLIERKDFDLRTRELVENEVLRIFCVLESGETATNSQASEPVSKKADNKDISEPNKTENNKLASKESDETKYKVEDENLELKSDTSTEVESQERLPCSSTGKEKKRKKKKKVPCSSTEVEDEDTGLPGGIEKLLQDYKKLVLTGRNSDLTIRVGGRTFKAHKCILASRSPVFEAMLEHDMKEKATGEVTIKDIDSDIFPDFLRYLYTGRVPGMTSSKALLLFTAADKYQVGELRRECLECVKQNLSVETFGDVMNLSLRYEERELTELATQFFVGNATDIVRTPNWQEFLSENVTVGNELFIRHIEASKK